MLTCMLSKKIVLNSPLPMHRKYRTLQRPRNCSMSTTQRSILEHERFDVRNRVTAFFVFVSSQFFVINSIFIVATARDPSIEASFLR